MGFIAKAVCCDNKDKAGDWVRMPPTAEFMRKACPRHFCIKKLFPVLTDFVIFINNMV
jgi:hypothetical protein